MPRIMVLFFLCLINQNNLIGQRLHMPAEIVAIMEASTVKYQFDSLETASYKYDFKDTGQLKEKLARIDDGSEVRLRIIDENYSKSDQKKLKKGDQYLSKQKFEKARLCYQLIYQERMSDPFIINKIAKTYLEEKDYATAAFWYERSLEYNFIDTESRRNMAQSYAQLGDYGKAVTHITYAHLFNRNNADILNELKILYKKAEYNYQDASFEPHYKIIPTSNNQVKILFGHSVWAAYAAVDAVWQYEPGYQEKMTKISNQDNSIIQKKESLLNALITYENLPYPNKKKRFPLFDLLRKISLEKQVDNFLIYEMLSKEDPLFVLKMTKTELEDLKNYLLVYRVQLGK